jgi:hypothetical protein
MVFIRLCEYHLYEEKILKWNQYNIGGLFVYCQNILASQCKENRLWTIPNIEKGGWHKIDIPYHDYFNYVLKNDLEKLKENRKVYQIEHYLIKYLNYVEFHRDNGNYIEDEQSPKESSFKAMLISFLFPWVR